MAPERVNRTPVINQRKRHIEEQPAFGYKPALQISHLTQKNVKTTKV
jgi:hypothetical protein